MQEVYVPEPTETRKKTTSKAKKAKADQRDEEEVELLSEDALRCKELKWQLVKLEKERDRLIDNAKSRDAAQMKVTSSLEATIARYSQQLEATKATRQRAANLQLELQQAHSKLTRLESAHKDEVVRLSAQVASLEEKLRGNSLSSVVQLQHSSKFVTEADRVAKAIKETGPAQVPQSQGTSSAITMPPPLPVTHVTPTPLPPPSQPSSDLGPTPSPPVNQDTYQQLLGLLLQQRQQDMHMQQPAFHPYGGQSFQSRQNFNSPSFQIPHINQTITKPRIPVHQEDCMCELCVAKKFHTRSCKCNICLYIEMNQ